MRRILVITGILICLVLVVGAVLVFFPSLRGYQKTSMQLVPIRCANPPAHAILNEKQAILAARSIWYCAHPNYDQTSDETNEHAWLRDFTAY